MAAAVVERLANAANGNIFSDLSEGRVVKISPSQIFVVVVVLVLASCGRGVASQTDDCKSHYDRILEIGNAPSGDARIRDALLLSTQASFDETSHGTDPECLRLLFQSLSVLDFYVRSEATLTRLRSALAELEAKGAADDLNRISFFRALVGHRRFDEARAFKLEHATLNVEHIPDIAENEIVTPAAYRVDASGDRLVPVSFDLGKVRLVAVVHPLCGFSKHALTAIASASSGIASDLAVYLAPVDQALYLDQLNEWNVAHASAEIFLASSREDWPFIESWATPSFYILKDGQVRATLIGWPDELQLEKLKQAIDSVQ